MAEIGSQIKPQRTKSQTGIPDKFNWKTIFTLYSFIVY